MFKYLGKAGKILEKILGVVTTLNKVDRLLPDEAGDLIPDKKKNGKLKGKSWQPFAERGKGLDSVSTIVDVYLYKHSDGQIYYLYLRSSDQKFVSAGLKNRDIKFI